MKIKRILATALSVAMALSLAVPAFAEDTPPAPKNQIIITGAYAESDIDVVVPSTANAVINPYGLGTTVTKSDGNTKVTLTGQIMTPALAIKNKSNLKLNVGATVSAVINDGSTMKLATNTTKGVGDDPDAEGYVPPATGKSAFVQLEVVAAPSTVIGSDDGDLQDLIIDESAKESNWTAAKKLTVGTKAVSSTEALATLNAGIGADEDTFADYKAGSIGLFRLAGDCVTSPKEAWAATDGFVATIVFSFAPAA